MKHFKLVEGTADYIENIATTEDLKMYELESLKFTYMSLVYTSNGTVSDAKVAFYVAVFRHQSLRK